jgi:hypothetical protein
MPAREQSQPEILGDVGVLVLVDEDVAEPAPVGLEHVRVRLQDRDDMQEQVAEVAGVERPQPLLVGGVERGPAVVEGRGVAGGHPPGRQGAVLPAVDQAREQARRPALLVDVLGADQLAQQPHLVVGVEDREVRLEPDQLGMAAQDLDAERMEGAEPGHALDDAADQIADARLHLARRLVGEGDGEDLVRPRPSHAQEMRDARGQRPGLAGAGAGEHEHRPVERLDRFALGGVERVEIGRRPRRARALGQRRGGHEGFGLVLEPVRHGSRHTAVCRESKERRSANVRAMRDRDRASP